MLVMGDAHATTPDRQEALFAAYRAADESVALQAGDLMYYDLPVQTYFVAGNNEDFDVIEALRHGRLRSSGVRNAQLLHSTAAEVEGRRVAGLSGNYAPTRFNYRRRSLTGERRRHFTYEDVMQAMDLDDVDVFLAHEAPHGLPVDEQYDVGCEYVDDILAALEPDLCLVGHHHQHAEATVNGVRVVSLAPVWDSYYTLDPDSLTVERHDSPNA